MNMATDEAGNAKDLFDEDGNHFLHVSVANGNLEITKHLVGIGSDVNVKNENHNTPLHLAVERNDSEMTLCLLQNGAEVNIGDKSNMTALHRAVRKNNAEISQHLIDNGADVNVLTEKRESALHTAALKNYPDMARLLVEKGADLETLNLEGFTAIQIAAECCHFEIVEFLLKKGADRRDIDKYKLHLAAGRGDRQLVEQYLLEDYYIEFKNAKLGHTALHWAAKNGSVGVIQTLLQHGAEVNSMDMLYGDRPLHKASYEGHADVVRVLIKAGANKESVNHDGHRAVHDAAAKGHLEVIKILLEEGADKNVLNAHGESPLIQAAEFGHADVVKVLLDAGADRHLPNDYGVYPICQIARRYNDYVVEHQGNTSEATFSMLKTLFHFLEAGSYVNTETKETLCKLQNIAKIICHRPNGQVEVHDILAKDIDDKVQHEFGIGSELSIMIFGMERQVLKTIIRLFGNRHVRSLILGNMDVSLINELEGRLGISHSVVLFNATSFNQYVTMSWLLDTVKVVCFIACDLVVPYKIQFLGRLNVLNVSHCKLMPKSEKLSNLNGRKHHSFSTRTTKLIQPRLHSVKELFLNNNGLTDLPEDIGDIPGLVVFSAHDNNIHNIPSSLINKSDYESFSIHNNPAVLIPIALQEEGKDAVLSYLREFLASRSVPNDRVKLILAGYEGSGKTTLVRALCEKPTDVDKTDGIEMATIKMKDSVVKLITFDFAGDVDFLETHTLFVTDDSLIIVTFDLSKCPVGDKSSRANSLNQYGRVLLWLQTIHVFAPNARVIIVGTHADISMLNPSVLDYIWQQFSDMFRAASRQHQIDHHDYYVLDNCFLCQTSGSYKRVSDFKNDLAGYAAFDNRSWPPQYNKSAKHSAQAFEFKLPHIVGYYEVSSVKNFPGQLRNDSIKQLRHALAREAQSIISDLLLNIPESWCNFREKLMAVKVDRASNPVMRYREYESLSREIFGEIGTNASLRNATAFLCCQGNIIFREGTTGLEEDDLVILNPEWLASLLRTLISFKTNFINDNGILTMENLQRAWVSVKPEHHDYLIRLLIDMGICFKFNDSEGTFLFPCKLPIGQPGFDDWPASPKKGERQASQMCHFSFLPPLLFCDLIGTVNKDRAFIMNAPIYYANQIVYLSKQPAKHCGKCRKESHAARDPLHHIRLELLYHSNSILITVRGNQPCCSLEQVVHQVINVWQKAEYRGLTMHRFIPCPKCIDKGESFPGNLDRTNFNCSRYQGHRYNSWREYLSTAGQSDVIKMTDIVDKLHRTLDDRECPRLFLLLPINEGSYAGLERVSFKVFSRVRDGFAVHLLCECPGNYHFLGTPGYRVNKINKFVKKYGAYVCKVLKFIGHLKGIEAVAGPTPVAASVFAATTVSSVAGPLLESFLEDFGDSFPDLAKAVETPTKESLFEFGKHDGDLLSRRELARFLGTADENRRFGGLIPIVHGEGVVWVCEKDAKLLLRR